MTIHSEGINPTDDEREALVCALAPGVLHAAAILAEKKGWTTQGALDYLGITDIAEPQGEPSDAPKVVTLDDVYEVTGLDALVAEARSRGEWCCENGCGSGACETCPCCSAGWCVSGVDGVPEDAEARVFWLEVAAEYNPVAAALRAAGGVR